MSLIKKLNTFLSFKLLGRKSTIQLISKLTESVSLDLLDVAHQQQGIASYGSYSDQSEVHALEHSVLETLKKRKIDKPVFFDVGANVGNYTQLLFKTFPESSIHSFEPNPGSFERLKNKAMSYPDLSVNQVGIGAEKSSMLLYSYGNDNASEHASLNKQVIEEVHSRNDLVSVEVAITSIDAYCEENNIKRIHFLKIDVEGFEMEVLKGAREMITANRIDIIQFEFNEMNVYSRIFLKDFYDILDGFDFFRLLINGLFPLGVYNPKNEIFRYQNIIAVLRKDPDAV